ncbi:MAG: class I SAM-dependent methyltransferase [Candidatus Helarchaeota archaeon]
MNEDLDNSLCLTANIKKGENIRRVIKSLGLFNELYKIETINNKILIPITRDLSSREKKQIKDIDPYFIITNYSFKKRKKRVSNFRDYLLQKVDPNYIKFLPKSFDTIGNIAIIEIPEVIKKYDKLIGNAIIKTFKSIRTVYSKKSIVSGKFRIRKLELIGGIDNPITIHKENGCLFELDVKKVYFSPRLSTERLRVVKQVRNNEKIIDMFAGVGTYSIQIAKKRDVEIIAFDINPNAINYFEKNIILNKVHSIKLILGNVSNNITKFKNFADRVIMNLPKTSFNYLKDACQLISKNGGIINYYQFISNEQKISDITNKITDEIKRNNRILKETIFYKKVKDISPKKSQFAFDIKII